MFNQQNGSLDRFSIVVRVNKELFKPPQQEASTSLREERMVWSSSALRTFLENVDLCMYEEYTKVATLCIDSDNLESILREPTWTESG